MKKTTAHVQDRFLNCLRIQIVPEHHEKQRINSVIKFCKEHDFDNVMLFINSEEYHVGHMTKEEAGPWLETMKRAKAALIKEGITVSLNPWIEIGQLDRGRKLKEGQNFVTVCDFNGRKSDMVACPFDENWKNYFMDFYAHIIREIEPEVVWIEDDFRMHNHPPLEYGGCFCEHHMKAYNEFLGIDYSREEFTEKMFGTNPDDDAKKAYLEVNRKCMRDLATDIGVMVKNLGLGTKIGLMSSSHLSHSMEYRDWYGIHKGFAQDGPMINRLHLPMYQEDMSIKRYYQLFNLWPFVCRGYLPEECHVLPEIENGSFMVYAKDAEVVRFQLESALPLEIEGMTYDIFDFTGNGAVEAFGYGEEIGSMLDVKVQDNYAQAEEGATTYDIRFIGSVNHLNYNKVGFVFSLVNEEPEIDGTKCVTRPLVSVYKNLNVGTEKHNVNAIYDGYSSYLFAFGINKVPAKQVIYARSYVELPDGRVIYGSVREVTTPDVK